jgi:hypothetical protein
MNNDIFDFKRFGNYFVTDIKNAIANYGWSMIILILFGLITFILVGLINTIFAYNWEDILNGGSIEWVHANVGSRIASMVGAATILIFTAPANCYGGLTDKNIGSNYILLPASRLEKFISMILMCCFVIPIVFIMGYLLIDCLICMVCPETGNSIISEVTSTLNLILVEGDVPAELIDRIKWTSAIDDTWMIFLFFLLGALVFKKSKAIKTFLVGYGITVVISIVGIIVIVAHSADIGTFFETFGIGKTEEELEMALLGYMDKIMLFDTIFDITINALLLTGIWFKLKTLKH